MTGSNTESALAIGDEASVEPMVAVYRHDIHKARMRSHEYAEESFRGVRVNEDVPLGADRDAALLSRPRGKPERTLDAHETWFRVSLLTGELASTVEPVGNIGATLRAMIESDDPEQLHAAWLGASVPALFNESPYYPYTSLKYHTLLAAALLDNYRAGFGFEELFLAVSEHDETGAVEVVPHRTVLSTPGFTLLVTGEPGGRPAVRLGDVPAQSFADVWARLPEFPFDVDGERRWRVLDAELRRVRSWSAALQFIEEYVAVLSPVGWPGTGDVAGGDGRDA